MVGNYDVRSLERKLRGLSYMLHDEREYAVEIVVREILQDKDTA